MNKFLLKKTFQNPFFEEIFYFVFVSKIDPNQKYELIKIEIKAP